MEKSEYCEYFLEHTKNGEGDDHIFKYYLGHLLMCDNYQCIHGNNTKDKILIDGDSPPIGICSSKGLKALLEDSSDLSLELA
jgi:hypothetical protein